MSVLASHDTPAEPPPLSPGSEIAPGYRVISHIRRGAELDAYDVWSDERYCRCFVKALRPDCLPTAKARHGLRREGRVLLKATHPHLVRAFDLIDMGHGRQVVLVLETISGVTLSHIIEDQGRRLTAAELAHLGQHVCSAIRYLHDLGYLHLDLKPSNIIAEAGRAKLIDLSLARPPGRSRGGMGTRPYMAPEQIEGGYLGPPADVWGLGLVLYEAATCVQPFDPPDDEEDSDASVTADLPYIQLHEPPPPIRKSRRLPPALANAIDACLRMNPADRPTLPELWAILAGITGVQPPVEAEVFAPVVG